LRLASARDSIEFFERFAARPADLTQAHHDRFEDDQGKSRSVDAEALDAVFQLVKDDVKAVVLNACYSELQALAIARSIAHVIGMSNAIGAARQ